MRRPAPRIHPRSAKTMAVLVLVLLATMPVANAYLGDKGDKSEYAKEGSCYCHGTEPSPEMDIVIRVPTQVAYTPNNKSVIAEVGLLGGPDGITSFAAYLNASTTPANVKWQKRFGNVTSSGQVPDAGNLLKLNGSIIYSIKALQVRWFNLSFIPGNADQTIELSVIGLRSDRNGNESGDPWGRASVTIEVREQRLMTINVPVSNEGSIVANDVLVDFYIDDEYIGNNTVQTVPEDSKENASIEWDITFKEDGKYQLRAVIDPQGRITEVDKSNNEITRTIWLGEPPEEEDTTTLYYTVGAAVGVVVVVALVLFWYFRRRSYGF